MNRILRAAATKKAMENVAVARLFRSFRTYGSRIGAQFINVYSLNPSHAIAGSILYWYETMK